MFGFIKKAIGNQRSSEFFLELDESKSVPTTPEAQAEPVNQVATPPKAPKESKEVEVTRPVPAKPEIETKPELAAPPAAPKVEEPPMVMPEPAFLQFNNTPRRRPGANMSMFRDMAKQVKLPSRG